MRIAARLAVLLLAGPLVAGGSSAAGPDPFLAHLQAGRAAFARDDRAAARRHLGLADSIVGGHPGARTGFAVLAAREGDREGALRWLGAVADMGLARPVIADTAFRRWAGDTAFAALASRFDANLRPVSAATPAFSLADTSALAEDVAWDDGAKRFLVSSIHRAGIVALGLDGRVTDFVAPGAAGSWGFYGLGVDAARGLLWASCAAGPECQAFDAADSGRTALVAFDLRRGTVVRRVELARRPARQVLGDLLVLPGGDVIASEGLGGALVRLRVGASAIETLVADGTFRSPQQQVLAADGRRIYVADYTRGIALVTLADGTVTWPGKPVTLAAGGIDGLYRDGDRLVAIQNGTNPHRVLELRLGPGGGSLVSWRVLERASDRLGEPNHGVLVGRDFWFIGDSGWDRVGEDGAMSVSPGARPPVLLRLALDARR